jgi:hypothetical protein
MIDNRKELQTKMLVYVEKSIEFVNAKQTYQFYRDQGE